METQPLTSVHTALQNAVYISKPPPGVPMSCRIDAELKNKATAICERHGTTLSEFLRQCCVGLVGDYQDPTRG